MTFNSTVDLFYLVLSISIGWVAIFLCWGLYELARMLHQANAVVSDAREKMGRLERAISAIKERLESSAGYLGAIAEGGKALLSFLHVTEEKKEKRRKKKGKDEDEE